jgi:acetylornithine deacetylase
MDENLVNQAFAKVNKERVVNLLKDLIRIPSYPGEELELAEFMADWLEKQGLQVKLQECTPTKHHKKSANVIAILPGIGGGSSIMLNGHLDTDPVAGNWKYDPWDPVIFDGNKMNGIGSTNMKGGDAGMIEAVLAIKDAGIRLKGDIMITLVCRELQGGWGIAKVLEEYKTDYGIVPERTFFRVGFNPAAGIIHPQIQIYGKAAHIHEQHERAINATVKLAKVVTALDKLDFPYTKSVAPSTYGDYPVMAVSTCRSGIGEDFYDGRPATIGDRAVVKMDVRTDSEQTEEMIYRDIQSVLDKLVMEDPQLQAKIERNPLYINRPFYELPIDSHIVKVLRRAHQYVFGEELGRQPSTGGTDSAFMWSSAKIPTVVYGMGGASQHDLSWAVDTYDLYVNIDELPLLAKVHLLCCLEICNTPKA